MAGKKGQAKAFFIPKNVAVAVGVVILAVIAFSTMGTEEESAPIRRPAPPPVKELSPEEEAKALKKRASSWMVIGRKYFSGRTATGKTCEKDIVKAFEFVLMAAEQGGDADGAFMVAQCYFYGYGVTKDLEKAKFWSKKTLEGAGEDTDLIDGVKKLDGKDPGELSVEKIEDLLEFDTGKGNALAREKRAEREEKEEEAEEKYVPEVATEGPGKAEKEEEEDVEDV